MTLSEKLDSRQIDQKESESVKDQKIAFKNSQPKQELLPKQSDRHRNSLFTKISVGEANF